MTVKKVNDLVRKAINMIDKGTNEKDVQFYIYSIVEGNPYNFIEVWDRVEFLLEYRKEEIE